MKFISKNANLNIILRPGQQAQPLTGAPAISALSVRFQNGMVEVHDEELTAMMLRHPALNQDFIAVEDESPDPYAYRRNESEPQHVTTEIKYGHPVARSAPPVNTPVSPELKKMIAEAAAAIAEQQRPALMKEAIEAAMGILSAQAAATPSTTNDPTPTPASTNPEEEKEEIPTSNKPRTSRGTK